MEDVGSTIPVLYVQHNAGHSGAPESLLHLIRFLDLRRFSPHVVCGREGWLVDELRARNVPVLVHRLPAWSKPTSFFKVRRAVGKIAEHFQANGIGIVHGNEHILAPYAILLGRRLGAVRLCHVRCDRLTRRRLWEYAYPWLDRAIVVSDHAGRALYRDRFTRHKTVTIYNGIDLGRFTERFDRAEVRRSLGLTHQDTALVTVGTICQSKNQMCLLRVLHALRNDVPKLKLLLVGENDGTYAAQMREAARAFRIEDRVLWLGLRHDVPRILHASDLFAFPSRSEGFPRSLLEAMAARLPVVASTIAPNAEAVITGESGVLVPTDDLDGWVRTIARLLRNPTQARRLGSAAGERVKRFFSASETSRRVAELYERLLIRRARGQ